MADIRVARPEEWNHLPIQPPAGYWLKRLRPLMIGILAAIGAMVVLVVILLPNRSLA